jgi:4-hydroxyphenylpyruvate dioxygenase-like putative hemolysin
VPAALAAAFGPAHEGLPVTEADDREAINEPANPLGMEGIEFIEYATARPQALGQVLETLGFRPIARHRSREVLLYRQGGINVIVNAHGGGAGAGRHAGRQAGHRRRGTAGA